MLFFCVYQVLYLSRLFALVWFSRAEGFWAASPQAVTFVLLHRLPKPLSRSNTEFKEQFWLLVVAPSFLPQQFDAIYGSDNFLYLMHLRSRLVFRPSTNNPLDNRAHSMANTGQAPYLEGLHYKMHWIVEQIRIMNENNACLIQHLSTNKPPLPTAPIPEVSRSLHPHQLGDRESQSHQSTGRACSTRN